MLKVWGVIRVQGLVFWGLGVSVLGLDFLCFADLGVEVFRVKAHG